MLNSFVGSQMDYSCISLVTTPVTTVTVDHPSCEMPTADPPQEFVDNSTEWIIPVAAAVGVAAFVVAFVVVFVYILRGVIGKPRGGNSGKIPF